MIVMQPGQRRRGSRPYGSAWRRRCDGPQSLDAAGIAAFASDVAAHADLVGKRLS
jgi:hypothetical protein